MKNNELTPYIRPVKMPKIPIVPNIGKVSLEVEGRMRASYGTKTLLAPERHKQAQAKVQSSLGSAIQRKTDGFHRINSEGGIKETFNRREGSHNHGVSLPTRETHIDSPIRETKPIDITGNLAECVEFVKQLNFPHRRPAQVRGLDFARDAYADSIKALNLCTVCYLPIKVKAARLAYAVNDSHVSNEVLMPLIDAAMIADWQAIKSDSKIRKVRVRRVPLDVEGNPQRVHNWHGKNVKDEHGKKVKDEFVIKPASKGYPLDESGLKRHVKNRTHFFADVPCHYRYVTLSGKSHVAFFDGNAEIPLRIRRVNDIVRFYKMLKGCGPEELFSPPEITTYRIIGERCNCISGLRVKF